MDKSKSLKEYISKAKIIIQDDKKLKELIDDELISRETAFRVAPNREALKMAIKGINVSQPGIL